MICSSRSSGIIFEKVAENAMPMSMKLSTGRGSRPLHRNPTPEAIRMVKMRRNRVTGAGRSFFSTRPASRPVTTPIARGSSTTRAIM